ncbi:MAG TPA: LuxR C-terminal-related transcriptional regulator [Gaiellaceae bacterium]|nr:LuxR C-terminal-related transcriptional regulator [Gaiellaceae bacterium]
MTRLLDDSGARFLLLVAPAGYGKTTLAREWIEGRQDVIWYSGGPAMADVAALAAGVAEALTARDEVAERVRILAAGGQRAQGLARAVAAAAPKDSGLLLVIDDYHHAAESPDADAFMSELVSLTQFRLLLTSRVRPAWITSRMALYGEATVLETGDLAFTDEEAEQVLAAEGQGSPAAIVSQAGGWPAVIGLAAMRGAASRPEPGLQAEDLYDYFAEDLFQSASDELKNALFLLALGGDASVEVARELLGAEHDRLVAEAAERGFLSRARDGSTAIHPLLRGFLVSKLREHTSDDIDAAVRQVVASLSRSLYWDECLTTLHCFPRHDLIPELMNQALAGLVASGRVATVRRWLELATSCGLSSPILMLAEAEVALCDGDWSRAQRLGELAGELLLGDAAARAYITAARAAHLGDDTDCARRNVERARELAMAPDLHAHALWLEFTLETDNPDPRPSSAALNRLRELHDERPAHVLRLLNANAVKLLDTGDTYASLRDCELAVRLLPRVNDPLQITNVLNTCAHVCVVLAEYEKALSFVQREIDEALASGLGFPIDHALIIRANALTGMRKLQAAQRALEELGRRAPSAPEHIAGNAALQMIRLRIALGDLRTAAVLVQRDPVGSARLRGEFLALRGLALGAVGEDERAEQALQEALAASRFFDATALASLGIATLGLKRATTDSEEAARDAIRQSINRGHIDPLVTACRAVPELARVGAEDPSLGSALTSVFARSRDIDLGRRAGLAMPRELRRHEGLSAREREVYELMIQGRTNRAIAQTLFISESTTKVHVRHIFEKLGVRTRAEAARKQLDEP